MVVEEERRGWLCSDTESRMPRVNIKEKGVFVVMYLIFIHVVEERTHQVSTFHKEILFSRSPCKRKYGADLTFTINERYVTFPTLPVP